MNKEILRWWHPNGHLNEDECIFLVDIIQKHKPKFCLETGTSTGRGSATILCAAKPIKHISVDINLDGGAGCWASRGHIENMLENFDNFFHFEGDSRHILNDKFIKDQLPQGVDLFFVDGGHSRDVCYSDMKNVWPHINIGGVMIVDDYMSGPPNGAYLPGVDKAVEEFSKEIGLAHDRWYNKGKGCAIFRK